MADELKSFKKDWERWSTTERLVLVGVVTVAALAALGTSVPHLVL